MVNRPRIGRIGRIHTDLICADPSDPPNRWSIHPSDASNTNLGHYLSFGYSASKYSRFTHNDGKTRIELRTPKEIQNMHGLSRPRWLSILAVLTLLSVVVPAQKSKTQEQD